MRTVYTGVGAHVVQSTSPTETVPADGDARTAASVNTALQVLLDHIALIWAGAFTGTGAGAGLTGIGGGTSGLGGSFTGGAPNGTAGLFQGTGSGNGVSTFGGPLGQGLVSTGGTPAGNGVSG